jgi:hypothetical protein
MQDARWPQLKQYLLERGWTLRDDALHGPHDTMQFAASAANADLTGFRDRVRLATEAASAYVVPGLEQAGLHDDLVSLATALDDVLQN